MAFDLKRMMIDLERIEAIRKKREKLYARLPYSKQFRIKVEGVAAFLQEHAVTDGKSFGLVVDGQVVENDDHMLGLLGDQGEITIEFRSVDLEPGGADEEVCRWLEHVERHGG
ncbi:hypothetical protein [Paramagnetospirillum caucaseum]|uniref:hypothetical protein n=1 Tax=Paramagnetospirillum caucaseum TaxID=1244869 RepID=UPI00126941BE|nr:hypothetical protein [Paramagnetospirillum caucaseum]